MFTDIARFELRYQMRQPIFWVVILVVFVFAFATVALDQLDIGAGGNVLKNSPYAILQTHLVMSMFFMFVTTAFVANIVVRDEDTGFAPIIRATPVRKRDYLFGRFTGAFCAAAISFLAVPLGGLVGSMMPWIDPETLGPVPAGAYVFGYAILALPGLWLTATLFFAVATLTRSMMWTYVCVVALLIVYVIADVVLGRPHLETVAAMADPFGLSAYALATQYWTATERNSMVPALEGLLLWNRMLWFGAGVGLLFFAYAYFRPEGKARATARADGETTQDVPPPQASGPPSAPPIGRSAAAWAQLLCRTRFELMQVFRSPAFAVLLLLGLFNALAGLLLSDDLYGARLYPVTRRIIETLRSSFSLVPVVVAIYYAGELVWRERDRRIHEIVDATPAPDWILIVPKVVAIALALITMLVTSTLAGVALQLGSGFSEFEMAKYLGWYLLPKAVDWMLIAILAVALQSVAPTKYLGWGLMLLYLVLTLISAQIGLDHNLLLYGQSPSVPLSDMNGTGIAGIAAWWFRAYWLSFSVLLLVLAHVLWRRGSETRLAPRLMLLPQWLMKGAAGKIALASLLVFALLGSFIFLNTNVWNEYRDANESDRFSADLEKTLLRYERLPQPAVTDVKLELAIDPVKPSLITRGHYVLENKTASALRHVHLRWDRDTRVTRLNVENARLEKTYGKFNYQIFRFARDLAPGERALLSFETVRSQRGFKNSGNMNRIVGNGTFVDNTEFAPMVGMSRRGLLADRTKRRRYGLPPELRMHPLADIAARRRSYIETDIVNSDITVTTAADQIPIAPGSKVSDVVTAGRRTARFVSDAPVQNFFSIQSARYAVKTRNRKGVSLEVYYHPQHAWNVDRMLTALEAGLDYFQENFGPYQYRQARIVEFPAYDMFAQAFAGTMPYSESLGFITDLRDRSKIDYVTYVTAHELGHQWWAHQVVGANVAGATSLSETLAQYSAIMVMEKLYGPEKIRQFLKFELDAYLKARGREIVEEVPLMRVENQGYIHYRKGSLVMYLLRDQMGEAAVNRALRRLIDRFGARNPPYPTSLDLIAALRAEAKPEQQRMITDLFEKITLYDVRTVGAASRRRPDGRWDVAVTVLAKKFYADGQGQEREVPLVEHFDVGLFTEAPGSNTFGPEKVILLETRPLRSGQQVLRFVTDRAPAYAGADPYNKRIDRRSGDNLAQVVVR
ncbi:ABC transporter permease/M1 family aminopeptidase [Sphingosinicella rhizophila]|uniref:M1 family aminopeptidase n=1 Tax=Sphingosinicella rhizophila TaxID=3050082 RepID=A0ABU3Q5N4_9SPHN|nr:M1 family aminopeptidase [Sphingosinicella sp. GR2756]MDT9598607.1 M1 family aminopeptidase [Sphingosinicella sp. GR2756]